MAKITIVFETDGATDYIKADLGSYGADVADNVHEALCQAIHEGDDLAIDWLARHVVDITVSKEK